MKAKSLVHMTALVAARFSHDLHEYYQRKVAEGKNKMNVLNAVKNKIIHRNFACVNQKRLYEKIINIVWWNHRNRKVISVAPHLAGVLSRLPRINIILEKCREFLNIRE